MPYKSSVETLSQPLSKDPLSLECGFNAGCRMWYCRNSLSCGACYNRKWEGAKQYLVNVKVHSWHWFLELYKLKKEWCLERFSLDYEAIETKTTSQILKVQAQR